jgi:hypothetical protein
MVFRLNVCRKRFVLTNERPIQLQQCLFVFRIAVGRFSKQVFRISFFAVCDESSLLKLFDMGAGLFVGCQT